MAATDRLALAGALLLAAAPALADLPPCKVGMHVERVAPLNYGARILGHDPAKGTWQVKSDADGLVDWVPGRFLKSSCTAGEAAPITGSYFIGRWSLFIGPAPQHEVIGDKRYLVVGPGAKAPPLQIREDGSYTWVIDSRKTIQGRWKVMAPGELKSGSKPPGVRLLQGEDGKDWQVTRADANSGNNRDAVLVERMDMGLSYRGTRMP